MKKRAFAYTIIAANLLSAFLRLIVIKKDFSVIYEKSKFNLLTVAGRLNTFYGRIYLASCCFRFHFIY
jgi:hypothetical protein